MAACSPILLPTPETVLVTERGTPTQHFLEMLQEIHDKLEAGCVSGTRVRKAAVQNIVSGGNVAFIWDTEDFDLEGAHDNNTNNTRLTAWKDGYYLAILGFSTETFSTTDAWQYWIAVNGGAFPGHSLNNGTSNTISGRRGGNAAFLDFLSAGDYIEGFIHHTMGSDLDFNGTEAGFFSMVKLF